MPTAQRLRRNEPWLWMTLPMTHEDAVKPRYFRLGQIIERYYREPNHYTLAQIGKHYQVTGVRVNQLRRQALRYIAQAILWQQQTYDGKMHRYKIEPAVQRYPRLWRDIEAVFVRVQAMGLHHRSVPWRIHAN